MRVVDGFGDMPRVQRAEGEFGKFPRGRKSREGRWGQGFAVRVGVLTPPPHPLSDFLATKLKPRILVFCSRIRLMWWVPETSPRSP